MDSVRNQSVLHSFLITENLETKEIENEKIDFGNCMYFRIDIYFSNRNLLG
jgi:hypothetical protein